MDRPRVLVVAGYDPSGGAGVLADVKTLESHGVYGYAVCTAITWQNERVVRRVDWLPEKDVLEQVDVCFEAAGFDWVKIGIMPSIGLVGRVVRHIRQWNPGVRVVWDPVIRSSSGTDFWVKTEGWEEVAAQCFVMTPNWEEMGWLAADGEGVKRCGCHLLLKGGHHPEHPGRDYLWMEGKMEVLEPVDGGAVYPKHGSGCVLASALAANLALGYALPVAAVRAKGYVRNFLSSNKSLLGWHDCIS
ncbi:MAG TPA: bifunctional hydroxymethylpyrimidine kinase/phosphomethylpyrimidine kinase [Puia sp.]|uniref:bifunctional hydroxymethylpyrimidine kinase/phosphomethylpyrimidine kinase n=1 Tax=Puia sp. TaxID=2045100 RepID=UPI002BE90A1D|nr:bifunctional hydroxymethylpyrimidine kinase/phosphomethylpyrimidine kinase [Puia sp.]HVU95104.1 bifunctional hydroxymethylpyrimidine kinase/phosphomethylpyrimidine kinase [Puia sp.]